MNPPFELLQDEIQWDTDDSRDVERRIVEYRGRVIGVRGIADDEGLGIAERGLVLARVAEDISPGVSFGTIVELISFFRTT